MMDERDMGTGVQQNIVGMISLLCSPSRTAIGLPLCPWPIQPVIIGCLSSVKHKFYLTDQL